MPTLYDLQPDAASILTLEPEELAGLALELINASEPNAQTRLHPTSFSDSGTIGPFAQADREQIRFAMAEGWNWLVNEGMLAPTPGGNTNGWHFVTRRGKKIKNRRIVRLCKFFAFAPFHVAPGNRQNLLANFYAR